MPVPHVVLASGAVVAVSVAVATALAMYENPELRRYADDIRRRVAVTLHSLGNGIHPSERSPMFNRPEDAEGFLQSRGGMGADPGVDADEDTRRRQREELMYWNSMRLQKEEEQANKAPAAMAPEKSSQPVVKTRGTTFNDLLTRDANADKGTYIVNTGAEVRDGGAGLRHRGGGFLSTMYANPFADENFVGSDEVAAVSATYVPGKDDRMSDIYSATTRETDDGYTRTLDGSPALIELSSLPRQSPPTLERQLAADEYMTASQDDGQEAYASIQAWAQDSSLTLYSPLAEMSLGPVSEPEVLSEGQLTPTESVSVIGSSDMESGEHATQEGQGRSDVLSGSAGLLTPVSWSDFGSVVSDNDGQGALHG
ncbi:hypothetical protein E4U34_002158 [Claviceps purpurea]|nr:hypothetical protein E4U38_002491 [Claviceps purpurea]KAG6221293.1 hypothetical protein E4U34_002158 [Claviceps purpurea]KAG6253284.1 hypothetical protein E4U23_007866 [Claviceps purpurea]